MAIVTTTMATIPTGDGTGNNASVLKPLSLRDDPWGISARRDAVFPTGLGKKATGGPFCFHSSIGKFLRME
jgi:hypothetical protein